MFSISYSYMEYKHSWCMHAEEELHVFHLGYPTLIKIRIFFTSTSFKVANCILASFVSLSPTTNTNNTAIMAPNTEKEITMDEVKKHNTADDCWLVIGNDATGEYRFFLYLPAHA